MSSLLAALKSKNILISDGAWGTFLHQYGLQPGECPELWNITHRDDVFAIAKSYIDAGADIILTNSFGGSPSKLEHFGLQNRCAELNEAAAVISRTAAGTNHLVLGSIGPTGVILMMGEVSEETLYDGFCVQADALQRGGVDAICIETMSALDEACLAIQAVRKSTGLEVVCTFTFEKTISGEYRTMMGVSSAEMVQAVKEAGACVIGSNCGNGFDQMIDIVREIRSIDPVTPILVHANAGKPIFQDGKTVFPETPEMMAAKIQEMIKSGANIIGGCCGTTPTHIQRLVEAVRIY
jgi:Methionine synthase I (cobalamin-dependent), methyltransferase domain